jgi:hypothetical protein
LLQRLNETEAAEAAKIASKREEERRHNLATTKENEGLLRLKRDRKRAIQELELKELDEHEEMLKRQEEQRAAAAALHKQRTRIRETIAFEQHATMQQKSAEDERRASALTAEREAQQEAREREARQRQREEAARFKESQRRQVEERRDARLRELALRGPEAEQMTAAVETERARAHREAEEARLKKAALRAELDRQMRERALRQEVVISPAEVKYNASMLSAERRASALGEVQHLVQDAPPQLFYSHRERSQHKMPPGKSPFSTIADTSPGRSS